MTTEIAVQASTELVIAPDQTKFTETQLAALKQLGVDNAPAGDVAVFFHQAKRTGLDPFAKQIYMIGRNTKVNGSYVMKYTIQTGIDGYRLNARRAADRNRDQLATQGPFWRGETGGWDDVWLNKSTPPSAAKFTVVRNGEPFTAVCMFDEYVQTYFDKDSKAHVPNSMWSKMPANQLAKCAEAAAWRRAYPDDFSGLVLEDAVQVIDSDGAPVRVRAERATGVDGLRAAITPNEPTPEQPEVPMITAAQSRKLHALLRENQLEDRDAGLAWISEAIGRKIESTKELTKADAIKAIELLDVPVPAPATEAAE